MRASSSQWLSIVGILVVAMLAAWWWIGTQEANRVSTAHGPSVTNATRFSTETSGKAEQSVSTAANALASAKTTEERNAALARLRQILATGSTNENSAAIRRLLDSKMDAATGLGFKIGKGGALTEAPTLRVFLLDQLARLDPAAAADYAKVILASKDSPDEWAVALRNLAWGDTSDQGRALLEQKTSEMLQYGPWQQNPSVGFLEAFDVAVYLGGTDLLAPLTDLVRAQDNPAVAHAAFLALDRLAINQPVEVLAALEAHPDWIQGREETRADYFARADVGDAAQRGIVETYLLDPARTPAELQAFAGVFPNANFMLSQSLLTQNATLDGATLRQRDQVSLQAVNEWLADPRFAKIRQPLEKLQARLQEFVNQEK
jgi:hypothetical protein